MVHLMRLQTKRSPALFSGYPEVVFGLVGQCIAVPPFKNRILVEPCGVRRRSKGIPELQRLILPVVATGGLIVTCMAGLEGPMSAKQLQSTRLSWCKSPRNVPPNGFTWENLCRERSLNGITARSVSVSATA